MVDAFMNEGVGSAENNDWTAMPASDSSQPAMMQQQMQAQDNGTDDVFGDAAFPVQAPVVTIQTASGAAQNLDDDLTEEEREIVRRAEEYQQTLKQ